MSGGREDSRRFTDRYSADQRYAQVMPDGPDGFFVLASNRVHGTAASLKNSEAVEFAEAVLAAAGVDAVVVTGLPDVEEKSDRIVADNRTDFWFDRPGHAASLWREVRRYAALARHIEQHQPVDPQVQALADDLTGQGVVLANTASVETLARVLHEKGWRREQ